MRYGGTIDTSIDAKTQTRMKFPHTHRLFRVIVVLAGLVVMLAALLISAVGLDDHIVPADVIVVPGNTVHADGTLSDRLQGRLDAALAIFKTGKCKAIFVSGAIGVEGVDEAEAMKRYLVQRGVPPTAVMQDSHGFNTAATAANAAIAMRQHGYSSVLAVSQFFHVARLQWLLKAQGLTVVGHAHARYFEPRDLYAVLREVAAMSVILFRQVIGTRD
jgi:vancomycin permeability regulator SanA